MLAGGPSWADGSVSLIGRVEWNVGFDGNKLLKLVRLQGMPVWSGELCICLTFTA